jgi:GNAT superfamily N-acetyltransferase
MHSDVMFVACDRGERLTVVAKDLHGHRIGGVMLTRRDDPPHMISELKVAPRYRHRGIGTRLIREILWRCRVPVMIWADPARTRCKGVKPITRRQLRRLYRQLGFVGSAERDGVGNGRAWAQTQVWYPPAANEDGVARIGP